MNVRAYASTALCVLMAGIAPVAASAELIYTNNMSDAAVAFTAVDTSPKHVATTWCVDTGDYNKHELKAPIAELTAQVVHEGCKDDAPVLLKRTLPLLHSDTMATEYRLTGTVGKYSLSGPIGAAIAPDAGPPPKK